MKKKKCDNKKQNSFDIKTNPTLLGKKKPNPYSLQKNPLEKKKHWKKTKKRKPLFKEHLSFENFFLIKIEFWKKTSPLTEKPFFLRNLIKETSIKKKNSFFEIIVHSLHATPKKDLKGGASPKEDLGGGAHRPKPLRRS